MQIILDQTCTHRWLTWDWDTRGQQQLRYEKKSLCEENLDERTAQDTPVPVAMQQL